MAWPTQSEPSIPDLSACEREAIQIPGAIEPHGALLVLNEPELVILQVSSNTLTLLGVAPEAMLGMHLGDVLTPEDVHRLTSGTLKQGKRRYVSGVSVRNKETIFECLIRRLGRLVLLELEPSASPVESPAQSEIVLLTEALGELDGALHLVELCGRIATCIRQLTGFDRVMVYRFLEDDSGAVIAEDRREDLTPYLGLRYPASDIPAQARRLYLLNPLRLKPDVYAERAAMVPSVNPLTGTPLDMTFCILRAMSPVHDEYLRNMGVIASMSISIVRDGGYGA